MFTLSETHVALKAEVGRFAEGEVAPYVGQWEKEGRFRREVLRRMAEVGLTRILLPPDWGGAGGDILALVVALEALAEKGGTAFGCGGYGGANIGIQWLISQCGTEDQKRKYLPLLVSGCWLPAFALTEPQAGSDARAIQTTARAVPEGYILNGTKVLITNGGEADLYVIMARTTRDGEFSGYSAFLVEARARGFSCGPQERKMGLSYCANAPLFLDDCTVPQSALLGPEGQGFDIAFQCLEAARLVNAATAVGLAQAAVTFVLEYLRSSASSSASATYSAVSRDMLADMATEVEAARLLTYRAASLAGEDKLPGLAVAMAKRYASDIAMRVCSNALDIIGEPAAFSDLPLERYVREAKMLQIVDGTNEIMRRIIAHALLT